MSTLLSDSNKHLQKNILTVANEISDLEYAFLSELFHKDLSTGRAVFHVGLPELVTRLVEIQKLYEAGSTLSDRYFSVTGMSLTTHEADIFNKKTIAEIASVRTAVESAVSQIESLPGQEADAARMQFEKDILDLRQCIETQRDRTVSYLKTVKQN